MRETRIKTPFILSQKKRVRHPGASPYPCLIFEFMCIYTANANWVYKVKIKNLWNVLMIDYEQNNVVLLWKAQNESEAHMARDLNCT